MGNATAPSRTSVEITLRLASEMASLISLLQVIGHGRRGRMDGLYSPSAFKASHESNLMSGKMHEVAVGLPKPTLLLACIAAL
jgi:hypothetical protein